MDPLFALLSIMFLCVAVFHVGRWSKEYPDEEEMIRRLKELRYQRKLKTEADAEVDQELKLR